ncbi:hypothetical protein J4410_01955 [Candidatus Woesearchaeota archaeon]|nr:hypothetical protein [Candidatus Woesearchaeota archaeon]
MISFFERWRVRLLRFRVLHDKHLNPHKRWQVKPKPWYQRFWFWAILIIILLSIFYYYSSEESESESLLSENISEQTNEAQKESVAPPPQEQPQEVQTPAVPEPPVLPVQNITNITNATIENTTNITPQAPLVQPLKVTLSHFPTQGVITPLNGSASSFQQEVSFLENLLSDTLTLDQASYSFQNKGPIFSLRFLFSNVPLSLLPTSTLTLLNTPYVVSNVVQDGSRLSISLMRGEQTLLLAEGETKNISFNGKEYSLEVAAISNPVDEDGSGVKLKINGEFLNTLKAGDLEISDGIPFGAGYILSEGDDRFLLLVNATSLKFVDGDTSSTTFVGNGLVLDQEVLEHVHVDAALEGDLLKEVIYRYHADHTYEELNSNSSSLRSFIHEEKALLGAPWDILFS